MTEENKESFVKSSKGGYTNQCRSCRNKENKNKYQAKKKQKATKKQLEGCLYKSGTNLIYKVIPYKTDRTL